MRTGILSRTALVLMLSMAIVTIGCQNGKKPDKGEPSAGGSDMPVQGTKYLGGQLVLEQISMPTGAGQPVTAVLKNVSGEDLEDLTARFIFFTPSTDRFSEYATEAVDDMFRVFMNGDKTLSVIPSGSGKLLKVELHVSSGTASLMPTTAREGGVPGTRFIGGLLEVVGVDDRLTFELPTIAFTIENVSGEAVQGVEYQVILRKRGSVIAETEWMPVDAAVAPGQRVALEADLSGTDVGAAESILRIRWEDL